MSQEAISSARPEVDRATLRFYKQALGVAAAAQCVDIPKGCVYRTEVDGRQVEASGSSVSEAHGTPGILLRSDDGRRIQFHLFKTGDRIHHGFPQSVDGRDLTGDGVERDALGLAVEPGVNGVYGDLEVYEGTELIHRAVSSGSQADWNLVYERKP